MQLKSNKLFLGGIFGAAILSGVYFLAARSGEPDKLDFFASCLKDRGATFYGAFWCPHCQNQKAMFGKAQKSLPYVECSTSDGDGQLQVCRDKNITGYPTWEFKDGSRLSGEIPLPKLGEKTGCALPE